VPKEHGHAFFRYVIRLRRRPVKLDAVLMRLEGAGVHCRRPVFRPLHRYLGLEGFPESEQAMEAALSVPLYPSLTEGEIAQVVHAVGEVLA
jgi:dTDP-4-amino-4,6-dideoxygalactose transaminase